MTRTLSGSARRVAMAAAFAAASLTVVPPARAATASRTAFAASATTAEAVLGRHSLRMLDGSSTTLAALRGEVVVVNFWATWCSPCRRELPRLDALHREMSGRGARVLAVSIDANADNVRRYAKSGRLTMPVAVDGPAGLAKQLDLRNVPTTLVLDREGRIAWSTGRSDDAELDQLASVVRKLVAGGAVAGAASEEGVQ